MLRRNQIFLIRKDFYFSGSADSHYPLAFRKRGIYFCVVNKFSNCQSFKNKIMKKTFLSIALILAVGIGSTFANDNDGISKSVKTSFSKDFKSATNVQWQQKSKFDKATFSLNDQTMFAYYDPTGMLLAVSRNITSENLPIKLQADLKNTYANYWISDLFENAAHDATTYYITLENADQKLILHSTDSSEWSVYKTISKEVK